MQIIRLTPLLPYSEGSDFIGVKDLKNSIRSSNRLPVTYFAAGCASTAASTGWAGVLKR